MDPPPRFYRMTWPLVLLAAHHFGWMLREASSVRIRESLRRAGQDYTLTPAQFFAGKPLAAALVALVLGSMMAWIGQNPWTFGLAGTTFGFYWPEMWLRDMAKSRNMRILKGTSFFLDIVTPCSIIHTIGMCYPIDVVFVDREARIVRVFPQVRAGHIRFVPDARAVLELTAGTAVRHGLAPGVRLAQMADAVA
ncbi:hypothetical protein SBBP2_610018 [Burkholderiales bacterium]|jgi:uncharacterized membrane protein (UPF0127 family)|nr:hypothetical protein SBBP2_610018 [Burkholderiales bacterium]